LVFGLVAFFLGVAIAILVKMNKKENK